MSSVLNFAPQIVFSPIDIALADFAKRKAIANNDLAAASAAVLSHQSEEGHSCIYLADFENTKAEPFSSFPSVEEWKAKLFESGLMGEADDKKLFIIDQFDRLFLYRFWKAESYIAKLIGIKISQSEKREISDNSRELLRQLFPKASEDNEVDWQAVAAISALKSNFSVISGGPGTGKTTTVAKIIVALLSNCPEMKIALCAPTGKAAGRLTESIKMQLENLGPIGSTPKDFSFEAKTIHRLLGFMPGRGRFRFNKDNTLPYDCVILDEASMVDLPMMKAVFSALNEKTKLILLGDENQLLSVYTGSVMGDICQAAVELGNGEKIAGDYKNIFSSENNIDDFVQSFSSSITHLLKSWRFISSPEIGRLANAILQNNNEEAGKILSGNEYESIRFFSNNNKTIIKEIISLANTIIKSKSVEEAHSKFSNFRILCAANKGKSGVHEINKIVESSLPTNRHKIYNGMPVMILENSYNIGVFNGDIGICWQEGGIFYTFFADSENNLKRIKTSLLPNYQSAWAMSIHKSQGSEFDKIYIILPDKFSEILSRQLLYTAITRARKEITFMADINIILQSINNKITRKSGLQSAIINSI
jgi:exodeoxyribonuclease V alpha subunit